MYGVAFSLNAFSKCVCVCVCVRERECHCNKKKYFYHANLQFITCSYIDQIANWQKISISTDTDIETLIW